MSNIFLFLLTSAAISFFAEFVLKPMGQFLNTEANFFGLLFGALVIDWFVGMYKHWINRTFDAEKMVTKLVKRVIVTVFGIIAFMLFESVEGIHGTDVGDYFLVFGRVTVLLYPIISIFENMHYVTGGKFPPVGFMRRTRKYNESGNIKDLTD
jgi:phage-related holin